MAYIVMVYVVVAYIVMARVVKAYIVMALYSYGLHSSGPYSHGLSYWPKGWMRVDSRRFGCWSNTREQCSRESDARV